MPNLSSRLFAATAADGTRVNKAGKTVIDAKTYIDKDGNYVVIFPSRVPMEAVAETENGNPYVQVSCGELEKGLQIHGTDDKGNKAETCVDVQRVSFRLNLRGIPKG